jgi:nitroreductase
MDGLMDEIKKRRSIRHYTEEPVADEALQVILESARLAPSGSNTQPCRLLVVRDMEHREQIMAADHHQEWMMAAPVFIVCAVDISCRLQDYAGPLDEKTGLFELQQVIRDGAIAIENMVLAAEHLGLGTCWTAWFTQEEMRAAVRAPRGYYIAAVLTLGHAAEQPAARPRKALAEMVSYEHWQGEAADDEAHACGAGSDRNPHLSLERMRPIRERIMDAELRAGLDRLEALLGPEKFRRYIDPLQNLARNSTSLLLRVSDTHERALLMHECLPEIKEAFQVKIVRVIGA